MFQDLFNHYLKRNPGYGRMNRRLSSLEKEVAELRRTRQSVERTREPVAPAPAPVQPPNQVIFPPTITINVNKNEKSDPLKAYTRKKTKRAGSSHRQEESPPVQSRSKIEDVLEKIMTQQANTPPPPTPVEKSPSHPTYIEFLNVETIIIDRYEQSNNFGALGIKSLEGKLNIGANYGDKSDLPDEAKEKLEEKLKMAKEWKTTKSNEVKSPPKTDATPTNLKPPWDDFEAFEEYPDWDDFFSKQPGDAENNK